MICGGVLYYRESEVRASDALGVALVNAVEALEDSVLLVGRDAYTGITYRYGDFLFISSDTCSDASALLVILDCVVNEVVDAFLEYLSVTFYERAFSLEREGYLGSLCDSRESLERLGGYFV